MFKNMKVGIRLGLGFGIIIAFMIVVIGISFIAMTNTQDKVERIVKINNVRIEISGRMVDNTREISIAIRNALLAHGRADVISYINDSKNFVNEKRKKYNDYLAKLEEMTPPDDVRGLSLIEKVKTSGETVAVLQDKILALALSGRSDEGTDYMLNKAVPLVNEWVTNMNNLIKYNGERNEMRYNQLVEDQNDARSYMLIIGCIALITAAALAFFLTTGIIRPLSAGIKAANRISSGDLTIEIDTENRIDELGILMQALKQMRDYLREQIKNTIEAVTVLSSSTSQVSATAKQLVTSTQETSTSVSETTATMEEVKQTSKLVSQKANLVSEISQNTAEISEAGSRSAEEFFSIMGKIREQMDFIANSIVKLSEQSQTIGFIIAAVNDLASQSNLLAVNASIEASKAGEHGKGFAVVAQEVRNLADQSKDATNQVRTILNDIQKSVTAVVMASDQGKNAVDAGVKQSQEARDAIRQMTDGIVKSSQASMQIVVSINEQVIGIDQVAIAMENIKKASDQIVESTRQSQNLSMNLNDLGAKMKIMTERFKV